MRKTHSILAVDYNLLEKKAHYEIPNADISEISQ